jgi:DNA-binding NtrC family response regulator
MSDLRQIETKPILIVDDHEDTMNVYRMFLKDYDCVMLPSRDTALDYIKKIGVTPACILMDYSMPGMSLCTFLETVQPLNIPIILVSALFDADILAKSMGMRYFMPKAVTPKLLVETVERAMQHQELVGCVRSQSEAGAEPRTSAIHTS